MSVAIAVSILLAVAAVTYLSRAGMILFLADRTLPEPVVRALRNVGPSVLAALVVTLVAGGRGVDGIEIPEMAALVAAGIVALATRNLTWSLLAGMGALWLVLGIG